MRSLVYSALPLALLFQSTLANQPNSNNLAPRDPAPAQKGHSPLVARKDGSRVLKRSKVHKRSKKLGEGRLGLYKRGHAPSNEGHKRWVWGTSIIQDPTGTETTQPIYTHTTPGVTLTNPFETRTTSLTPTPSSSSTSPSSDTVFTSTSSHIAVVATSTLSSAPTAAPTSTSAQVAMAYPFVNTQSFDEVLVPGMCPGVFQGENTVFICTCLSTEANSVFVGCTPSTKQDVVSFCAGTAPKCLANLCPTGTCDKLEMTGSVVPSSACGAGTGAGWKVGSGCGCYTTGTARVNSCEDSTVCVSQQIQGTVGSGATLSQCLAASNSDVSTPSASSTTPLLVSSTTTQSDINTVSSLTSAPTASPTPPDSTHTWTLLPYGTTSIWVEVYSYSTSFSSSRRSTSPPPPPPTSTIAPSSSVTSSSKPTSTSSVAPAATCSQTAQCTSPIPANAHQRCFDGKCTFGCNKHYVLDPSATSCVRAPHTTSAPLPPSGSSTSAGLPSPSSVTCSQTTDCPTSVPANAHRICWRKKAQCGFACNKRYELAASGEACVLSAQEGQGETNGQAAALVGEMEGQKGDAAMLVVRA